MDYGFNPGTDSYNRCVVREAQSRAAGRVPGDYAAARLIADARDACYSYGLQTGSAPYDRCVDARSKRAAIAGATTLCIRQPRLCARTGRLCCAGPGGLCAGTGTYAPAATTPPAGVQAFRDEYGFRYDGQGNRLDAQGNIISPQSTRP